MFLLQTCSMQPVFKFFWSLCRSNHSRLLWQLTGKRLVRLSAFSRSLGDKPIVMSLLINFRLQRCSTVDKQRKSPDEVIERPWRLLISRNWAIFNNGISGRSFKPRPLGSGSISFSGTEPGVCEISLSFNIVIAKAVSSSCLACQRSPPRKNVCRCFDRSR